MVGRIARYMLGMMVTLWCVGTVTFLLAAHLPGDAATALLGAEADPAAIAAARSRLDLDTPVVVHYAHWLLRLLHGDLGRSLRSGQPVGALVLAALGPTLLLAAAASILGAAIGIPAGLFAALVPDRRSPGLFTAIATVLAASPGFVWGVLLIYAFSVSRHWLPASGYVSPWEATADGLRHLAMPALALAPALVAAHARMVRAVVRQQVGALYVTTARAKGLSWTGVATRHILGNAAAPILATQGVRLAHLLGGAAVIESLFVWPGLGKLAVDAVLERDTPLLQGCVLSATALVLAVGALTDGLTALIDPREVPVDG